MMMSLPLSRMRSTTSRYSASSMLGLPVSGLRTWMCAMAAPARPASMAAVAICAGVTGMLAKRPAVSSPPVTAQVIITFRAMSNVLVCCEYA
jgi:hypothetical protein